MFDGISNFLTSIVDFITGFVTIVTNIMWFIRDLLGIVTQFVFSNPIFGVIFIIILYIQISRFIIDR